MELSTLSRPGIAENFSIVSNLHDICIVTQKYFVWFQSALLSDWKMRSSISINIHATGEMRQDAIGC